MTHHHPVAGATFLKQPSLWGLWQTFARQLSQVDSLSLQTSQIPEGGGVLGTGVRGDDRRLPALGMTQRQYVLECVMPTVTGSGPELLPAETVPAEYPVEGKRNIRYPVPATVLHLSQCALQSCHLNVLESILTRDGRSLPLRPQPVCEESSASHW